MTSLIEKIKKLKNNNELEITNNISNNEKSIEKETKYKELLDKGYNINIETVTGDFHKIDYYRFVAEKDGKKFHSHNFLNNEDNKIISFLYLYDNIKLSEKIKNDFEKVLKNEIDTKIITLSENRSFLMV